MSSIPPASSKAQRFKRAVVPAPGPVRTFTKATLANTIGNGLFMTIEVIFFTRSVGLSNHEVAVGLAIAAGVGLLVNIPAGHLADRRGPRGLAALFLVLEGASMAAFVLVHSFTGFLVVATAGAVTSSAGGSIRMAITARMGVGDERVRTRAYLRAVTNFGISVGTIFAGVALAVNTREAYVAMVLGNALTFAVSALYLMKLPVMSATSPRTTKRGGGLWVVLGDRRFLLAAILNGLFSIHFVIQSVGLPLWVIEHTHAPRWWVAVLFILNTTMVVLLQVRSSRGTGDAAYAARVFRRSGLLMGAACLLYASAQGATALVASAVLVLGMIVHTMGEMSSSAASWGISFAMAPEELQGQYQGAYSTGRGISGILGPLVVIATAITLGRLGWFVLGVMFVALGAAFPPLIRSYLKTLERVPTVE